MKRSDTAKAGPKFHPGDTIALRSTYTGHLMKMQVTSIENGFNGLELDATGKRTGCILLGWHSSDVRAIKPDTKLNCFCPHCARESGQRQRKGENS
jgi:hypothetical protein